jgi:hypothetical protein
LNTPASVNTNSLPALTKENETAATFSKNATAAFEINIAHLASTDRIEWLEPPVNEDVDSSSNGRIVVQRHQRIHIEPVENTCEAGGSE